MSFTLDGRVALITGASSGFGAHFARLYVAAGAKVVLGARRVDRIEALAAELGAVALAVPLDVADEASTIAAYDAAEARFGTVDTIIANAGMSHAGRATEVSVEGLRQLLDANFLGAYLTVREGAKRLIAAGSRDSGRGRAIIIGSITAQGDSAYAASKAGVAHLGRNLAREWVRQGINVNVIQPGYVQTEIAGDWFQTEGGAAHIASFHRKRMMNITALDPLMLYFASDASQAVTGAVVDVDDGQSL